MLVYMFIFTLCFSVFSVCLGIGLWNSKWHFSESQTFLRASLYFFKKNSRNYETSWNDIFYVLIVSGESGTINIMNIVLCLILPDNTLLCCWKFEPATNVTIDVYLETCLIYFLKNSRNCSLVLLMIYSRLRDG